MGVGNGVIVLLGPARGADRGNRGERLFRDIRRIRDSKGTEKEVMSDAIAVLGAGGEGAGSHRGGRLYWGNRRIWDSRDAEEGAKACRRSWSILAPVHRWR